VKSCVNLVVSMSLKFVSEYEYYYQYKFYEEKSENENTNLINNINSHSDNIVSNSTNLLQTLLADDLIDLIYNYISDDKIVGYNSTYQNTKFSYGNYFTINNILFSVNISIIIVVIISFILLNISVVIMERKILKLTAGFKTPMFIEYLEHLIAFKNKLRVDKEEEEENNMSAKQESNEINESSVYTGVNNKNNENNENNSARKNNKGLPMNDTNYSSAKNLKKREKEENERKKLNGNKEGFNIEDNNFNNNQWLKKIYYALIIFKKFYMIK